VLEGHRIGRDRAAVRAAGVHVMGRTRYLFHSRAHQRLERMRRAHIAPPVETRMDAGAQKARMLARAIIVQLAWRSAAPRKLDRRMLPCRPMRPAFKRALVEPRPLQHGRGKLRMFRFARMRRARQRDLAIAETERVGSPAFHEWQRLYRLDGRARKDRPFDIADRKHQLSGCIADRDCPAMPAFDRVAAKYFHQDRIAHSVPTQPAWPPPKSRKPAGN